MKQLGANPPPFNLPGGSLFANPYGEEFYLFLTTDSSGTSTVNVVSGLDTLLLTQQSPPPAGSVYIPPEQNLNVWGDTVVIDSLALPGRSVTIWAQTLQWSNGSKIDVSGGAPTPPPGAALKGGPAPNGPDNDGNNPGQPGVGGNGGVSGNTAGDAPSGQPQYTPATGTAAGAITIYAGTLDDHAAPGAALTLLANGGAGGNGQDAQAGQDGGNGGGGKAGVNWSAKANSWPSWPSSPPLAGGNGGAGGGGGNGGSAAAGGNAGSVTIAALAASSTAHVSISAAGGAGGAGGAGANGGNGGNAGWGPPELPAPVAGTAGSGGSGGNAGAGGAGGTIHWFGLNPSTSMNGGAGGAGGAAGSPGNPGAPNGAAGSAGANPGPGAGGAGGSASALASFDYTTLSQNASSLQCSMMMQKANLRFLTADPSTNPSAFGQAAALVNWLQSVTYPVVQSAPPAPNPDQTILIDVFSQAQAMAAKLHLGHDYYGNLFTHVPRVAYSTQQTLLNAMLVSFKQAEDGYTSYFNALQQSQASYNQVVAQESATSSQITATQGNLKVLVPATQQLVKTLDAQLQELEAAKAVMDQKIANYRGDLEAQARKNGCAMAGIDIMKKVAGTFTGAVTGNSSGLVAKFAGQEGSAAMLMPLNKAGQDFGNQNDVISKVQVLLRDIQNLGQVYVQNPNEVNAGTYKLLCADQSALQQMLQQYTSVLPDTDDGKAALDSIKHFIQVVQHRNVLVTQYNANLAQYVSLNATLAKLTAQLQQVQNLPTNANAGLPWIVAFMGRLYHTVRDELLYQMYLTGRSLGYWSLNPSASGLKSFINVSDPASVNSSTLNVANVSLLAAFNTALESFGTGTISTFPAAGQPKGIVVRITKEQFPAVFEVLKRNTPAQNNAGYVHSVSIAVNVVNAHTPSAASAFAAWANPRISTARPWIYGAKTTGGSLTVNLLHEGAEAFADSTNHLTWFTHSSISATFTFTIKDHTITRDADGFGAVQAGTGGYYQKSDFAPPGPFAMWKIILDPDFNTGLDVSGVDSIELEFRGAGYSFSMPGL